MEIFTTISNERKTCLRRSPTNPKKNAMKLHYSVHCAKTIVKISKAEQDAPARLKIGI